MTLRVVGSWSQVVFQGKRKVLTGRYLRVGVGVPAGGPFTGAKGMQVNGVDRIICGRIANGPEERGERPGRRW